MRDLPELVMGYADYWTVARTWTEKVRGWDVTVPKNPRMYPSNGGDELFSYGSHFTLARALRGKKRELTGFVLNGDRYSVTTSRHQSDVRAAVQRLGYPTVILPFSALSAAGIDPGDVEIIDVLPDRREETKEEHWFPHGLAPTNAIWEWVPKDGLRDRFPEELQAHLDKTNSDSQRGWEDRHGYALEEQAKKKAGVKVHDCWSEYLEESTRPELLTAAALDHKERHQPSWQTGWRQVHAVTHHELVCWKNARKARTWDLEIDREGVTYSDVHLRHWLGESLVRARIEWFQSHRCPTCRGKPVQGPEHRVWQEDAAYWRSDDPAQRWGEAPFMRAMDYPPQGQCQTCSGRLRVTRQHSRTAYFLSGFDRQEYPRNVYFFCELPKGADPRTVTEAYEALKPQTVKAAELLGREVKRQGDIFAIRTGLTRAQLREQGARFERLGPLFGTNHVATEVAELGDLTLVRGTLHHKPQWRRPDHKRVTVGSCWHIAVKNTVPISG